MGVSFPRLVTSASQTSVLPLDPAIGNSLKSASEITNSAIGRRINIWKVLNSCPASFGLTLVLGWGRWTPDHIKNCKSEFEARICAATIEKREL